MTHSRRLTSGRQIDMTTGPLLPQIFRFILPLIATNMLQQFYHVADTIIVGFSSEPDAMGAVGSAGAFLAMMKNLFTGFSIGANVVVARYIGAHDKEKASQAAHTAIGMSVLFGLLGSAIGILLTRPVLTGMGYTGNLLILSARYSYIYLAGLPFLSLTNFLAAIHHAQGDTRTSLVVLSAAGVLNIILNCIFVIGMGLSVEGVATATAIANIVSTVFLWIHLAKKGGECTISFRNLRLHRKQFAEISRVGFPAGIENALFSISNIIIQSSVLQVNNLLTPPGSAYAPVIKGHTASANTENFIFQALAAITAAASAFTAQNVGANNFQRVRSAFRRILWVGIGIAAVMVLAFTLFRDPMLYVYGIENTGEMLGGIAYETALKKIIWKWPGFALYAIMNTFSGTIRGLGKSSAATTINFFTTCVFRIVWIYTVFAYFTNLESIYISYPISWLLTSLAFFIVLRVILSHKETAATQM